MMRSMAAQVLGEYSVGLWSVTWVWLVKMLLYLVGITTTEALKELSTL